MSCLYNQNVSAQAVILCQKNRKYRQALKKNMQSKIVCNPTSQRQLYIKKKNLPLVENLSNVGEYPQLSGKSY